jgi:hypothetical protein
MTDARVVEVYRKTHSIRATARYCHVPGEAVEAIVRAAGYQQPRWVPRPRVPTSRPAMTPVPPRVTTRPPNADELQEWMQ